MKRKRFADEQITHALRQAEGGAPVAEVWRKMQISEGHGSTGGRRSSRALELQKSVG